MKEATVKQKKKKNVGKKIFSTILFVLLGGIFVKSLCSIIDRGTNYSFPLFGLRESVIVSNSMASVHPDNEERLKGITNQFQVNDIVCTNMAFTYDSLQINDIVTYRSDIGLICHRIIDKFEEDGKPYVVTQGDANNLPDGGIPFSEIVGKVYAVIPKAGIVISFLQSPFGAIAIFGTIASITGGILIANSAKEKEEKKAAIEKQLSQKVQANPAPIKKAPQQSPKNPGTKPGETLIKPKAQTAAKPVPTKAAAPVKKPASATPAKPTSAAASKPKTTTKK